MEGRKEGSNQGKEERECKEGRRGLKEGKIKKGRGMKTRKRGVEKKEYGGGE